MNNNINVTLPNKALDYIDKKEKAQYLSRSSVARCLFLEELNIKMVVEARQKGYSIRKTAELTNIPYATVLTILGETQTDQHEESDEEEQTKIITGQE